MYWGLAAYFSKQRNHEINITTATSVYKETIDNRGRAKRNTKEAIKSGCNKLKWKLIYWKEDKKVVTTSNHLKRLIYPTNTPVEAKHKQNRRC